MGYIDFHDYYLATVLTQLKEWFLPLPHMLWGQIESSFTTKKSLLGWLHGIQLGCPTPFYISPTMAASNKAWWSLNNLSPNSEDLIKVNIPNTFLEYLIDNSSFTNWHTAGIHHIDDLYIADTPKSFPQLQAEFQVAKISISTLALSTVYLVYPNHCLISPVEH